MIANLDLLNWLNTLGVNNSVAVDEGGLTLVEFIEPLDGPPIRTGNYLEIGGIPDEAHLS